MRNMMQVDAYLTTEEAAAYLRLKERKLYELVAHRAVPCSKVTGKWLFPRAALDRWVTAGLALPDGLVLSPPPPIVGGSHDPLLEWAVRQSGSGLALLSEGSEAGLDRLGRDEVSLAAIHLHGDEGSDGDDDAANVERVAARPGLHDAVVIAFARREQGLLTARDNPLGLDGLVSAAARNARFGLRQAGAGAQLLLRRLAGQEGLAIEALAAVPQPYPTGADLALAIRAGEIDCGIATRAVAATHGLGFLPLAWERFDLVMRRRTYFEPGPQRLLALLRSPQFGGRAADLTGYDIAGTGAVRLNM